jgi:hypothetical protein
MSLEDFQQKITRSMQDNINRLGGTREIGIKVRDFVINKVFGGVMTAQIEPDFYAYWANEVPKRLGAVSLGELA